MRRLAVRLRVATTLRAAFASFIRPPAGACGRAGRPALASCVLAACLVVGLTSRAAAQDVGLPIGASPAAAQVEDLDGNPVDTGSLIRGKPTLVEFWATWCPLCKALQPRLDAAKKKYGDKVDFIIIGVAVNETPRRIKKHLEDNPLPGPIFYDRRGAAVRAFRAPATSYVVILDADGKVAYTGSGSDQPIGETLAKVLGG